MRCEIAAGGKDNIAPPPFEWNRIEWNGAQNRSKTKGARAPNPEPKPQMVAPCFSCNQKRFHCLTIKLLEKASLAVVSRELPKEQAAAAAAAAEHQKGATATHPASSIHIHIEVHIHSQDILANGGLRRRTKQEFDEDTGPVNENTARIPHGNGSQSQSQSTH